VVQGVVMVGLFGDNWCGVFCTGFSIATCTRFGMSTRVALCVELVHADALVNVI